MKKSTKTRTKKPDSKRASRVQRKAVKGAKKASRVHRKAVKGAKKAVRVQKRPVKGAKKAVRVQKRPVKGAGKAGRVQKKPVKGAGKAVRVQKRVVKGDKKAGRVQLRLVKDTKKSGRGRMKEVEDMLFEMKEQLIKEISENIKIESETLKAEIGDIYDIASWDRERELSLLLGDRDRAKLIQIEEALSKIDEGVFGLCEECGEKISIGRLMVMPFAKVCVECKSRMEREEESLKGLEEEGTYQNLISFDLDEEES